MTKTLVHVLDFLPRSRRSMDLFLLSLAEKLRETGWRTVHVFSAEPTDYFRERLKEIGSPFLVTKMPLTLASARQLSRQLQEYSPTVVMAAFLSKFSPALRLLKRRLGASRLIVADHAWGSVRRKGIVGRLLSRVRGFLASTWIDRVVAVSNYVRRRAVEDVHLPAAKVQTIYNGVDVGQYVPTPGEPNPVFTIACVGQLIPEKGYLTLFRAAAKLVAEGITEFRIRIAGKGPHEPEMRQFCAENRLTQVELLGHIDWVPRLLSSSDVVVIPSEEHEACSFAILESMACGACLVVSDVGGNPELVGEGGEAGLIFRPGDTEGLTARLRELMSDPERRNRMRAAARERALAQFSIERMVSDYVAMLENLTTPAQSCSPQFCSAQS